MATEIQQKPNVGDEQLRQNNQSNGDALRPRLEDLQAYGDHNKQNTSTKNDFKTSQTDLSKGSLEFTPIAGFDKAADKTGHSKTDDANGIPDEAKDSKKSKDDEANNISNKAGDTNSSGVKVVSDKSNDSKSDDASSADRTLGKKDDKENSAKQSTDRTKDTREAPIIPENQEIALDSETQKAKDDFVKILEDRFKDDPRAQDNPQLVQTIEARLNQMDQRILHERVKCDDGSYINQQEQLANEYRNLARIGTEAEKLTYTDTKGNEHPVFSQPWMVNNILASSAIRGADPVHFYNQGKNNTCAAESINRQGDKLLAGEDSKTIADICTKGEFEAVDKRGNQFICKVDKQTLSPDREAQSIYLDPTNARDAYGLIGDVRTAQLNLDIISREEAAQQGKSGGEGRYAYSKVAPTNRRDTGERVVDTRTNQIIANSPCLDAEAISNVKQSLYGRFIGANFGKETTLVSAERFNVPNATGVRSGTELASSVRALEAKGWGLPTVGTHVSNYVGSARGLSGAEGWHATSIQSGENGGFDFVNNWGNEHFDKGLAANNMFNRMNNAPAADSRRGDHIFDPDGVYVKGDGNPLRDRLDKDADLSQDKNKTKQNKEDELIAQSKKAQQREEENNLRQIQYARIQLAEIESKLAGLSPDSQERTRLLAQKQIYEHNSSLT